MNQGVIGLRKQPSQSFSCLFHKAKHWRHRMCKRACYPFPGVLRASCTAWPSTCPDPRIISSFRSGLRASQQSSWKKTVARWQPTRRGRIRQGLHASAQYASWEAKFLIISPPTRFMRPKIRSISLPVRFMGCKICFQYGSWGARFALVTHRLRFKGSKVPTWFLEPTCQQRTVPYE